MYFDDYAPPHFHARYGGQDPSAMTGRRVNGSAPGSHSQRRAPTATIRVSYNGVAERLSAIRLHSGSTASSDATCSCAPCSAATTADRTDAFVRGQAAPRSRRPRRHRSRRASLVTRYSAASGPLSSGSPSSAMRSHAGEADRSPLGRYEYCPSGSHAIVRSAHDQARQSARSDTAAAATRTSARHRN